MTAAELRALTVQVPSPAPVTFLVDGREVEFQGYGIDIAKNVEIGGARSVLGRSRLIVYLREVQPCQDQSASSTSTGSSPTSGGEPAQPTDATTTS